MKLIFFTIESEYFLLIALVFVKGGNGLVSIFSIFLVYISVFYPSVNEYVTPECLLLRLPSRRILWS